MIRLFTLLALTLTLITAPHMARAEQPVHALTVQNPYAYPTAPQQKNGAIFLTLKNTMPVPDKLIAAYADISERIELHTHMMDGDIMMMREVEGYGIPAGGDLTLEPTGHHIMLIGLKEPLTKGDKFRLTLDFEKADDIIVNVHIGLPQEESATE